MGILDFLKQYRRNTEENYSKRIQETVQRGDNELDRETTRALAENVAERIPGARDYMDGGNINIPDSASFAGDYQRALQREIDREIARRQTDKVTDATEDARDRMRELLRSRPGQRPPSPTTPDISDKVQDAVVGFRKSKRRGVSYLTSAIAGETGDISGRRQAMKSEPQELLGRQKTLLGA
jgi:hypothetical protein